MEGDAYGTIFCFVKFKLHYIVSDLFISGDAVNPRRKESVSKYTLHVVTK